MKKIRFGTKIAVGFCGILLIAWGEGDVGSNATWRRMEKEGHFPSLPWVPVPPHQFHPSPHLCNFENLRR